MIEKQEITVTSELGLLGKSVAELNELSARFLGLLGPVMCEADAKMPAGGEVEFLTGVPLISEIHSIRCGVDLIRDRLSEAVSRIAI